MKEINNQKLVMRKFEWLFALVVILVTVLVLGNYIVRVLTGQQIDQVAETQIIRSKVNNTDKQKNTSEIISYQLVFKNNDWRLYKEGAVAQDYSIRNVNGEIALVSVNPNSHVYVRVDGVRDYHSRDGMIVTDIPYNPEQFFTISEQEDLFPLIGYHNIYDNEDDIVDARIEMRKSDFEKQLVLYNEQLNCRWMTLLDVLENYILVNKKIPRNLCVMTFDDGRINNYDVVLPLLKKNKIEATFFIIAGRMGQKTYMSVWQVASLYAANQDIESHTTSAGSLTRPEWLEGMLTDEELEYQVRFARSIFNEYGFDAKLFAYPLGDYNDKIVNVVKSSGYIAARAKQKHNLWRDPRSLAASSDPEFIWQLNYYQPELASDSVILNELSYSGWWQFEEGYVVVNDNDNNISAMGMATRPTHNSYGSVRLVDWSDSIVNSFILEYDGSYTITILASGIEDNDMIVSVDSRIQQLQKDDSQDCITTSSNSFCFYKLNNLVLKKGLHDIQITNSSDHRIDLDKFSIHKNITPQKYYDISVEKLM